MIFKPFSNRLAFTHRSLYKVLTFPLCSTVPSDVIFKSSFRLTAELSRRNFTSPPWTYTFTVPPHGSPLTLWLTCSSVLPAALDRGMVAWDGEFFIMSDVRAHVGSHIHLSERLSACSVPGCIWACEHLFGKLIKHQRMWWDKMMACAEKM